MLRAIRMSLVFDVFGKLFTRFDKGYYIESFCVEKNMRRKGIGKMLINSLFEGMGKKHEKVYLDVSILNTRAIKLYKNLGFEIVGKKMLTPDLSTYLMRKLIN
jgi:ribosomal protein S18 acetylase RimI-like enzyme